MTLSDKINLKKEIKNLKSESELTVDILKQYEEKDRQKFVDEKLLEKVLGDTDNPWKIKILPMPTATPTLTPTPGGKMKILPMPTATPNILEA